MLKQNYSRFILNVLTCFLSYNSFFSLNCLYKTNHFIFININSLNYTNLIINQIKDNENEFSFYNTLDYKRFFKFDFKY